MVNLSQLVGTGTRYSLIPWYQLAVVYRAVRWNFTTRIPIPGTKHDVKTIQDHFNNRV